MRYDTSAGDVGPSFASIRSWMTPIVMKGFPLAKKNASSSARTTAVDKRGPRGHHVFIQTIHKEKYYEIHSNEAQVIEGIVSDH